MGIITKRKNSSIFKMLFKVQLVDEIHCVNADPKSFQELSDLVALRFGSKMPESFYLTYKDEDGDWVRVASDDDFQMWHADFEAKKAKKLSVIAEEGVTEQDDSIDVIEEDEALLQNSEEEEAFVEGFEETPEKTPE